MLVRNGTVHDAVHKRPYKADLLLQDGKIAAIGQNLEAAEGEEILDASGLQVWPGLVDAHSHLGLKGYAIGEAGNDINEKTDPLTPQMCGIDAFYPQDHTVKQALESGVTTVGTGPGSTNVVGGTFFAVKTFGSCVDDMIVKDPVAMKCAFGENPKVTYASRSVASRMGIACKLKELLFAAQDYKMRKEAAGGDPLKAPKYDMKMEAMLPVLNGEIPLKAHAHRADDICTAIRIAKQFGLKLTVEHCTDGEKIIPELLRAGWPVAVGPALTGSTKTELFSTSFTTPGVLAKAGLQVSIITDAPVIPEQFLSVCAGLAVRSGMDPFEAFRAITINPAKHLGIEERVGSLEVGKDADVVLTDGDILQSETRIFAVLVDGKKVVG